MKKTYLIYTVVLLLCLGACKKSSDSLNTLYSNKITINDNGKQYSVQGETYKGVILSDKFYIIPRVIKGTDGATFDLTTNMNIKRGDFDLSLETEKGSLTGIGTFNIPNNAIYSDYVENFENVEGYKIIGGSVNITQCTPKLLQGTFTITVTNGNRTKTVTGSFYSSDPYLL